MYFKENVNYVSQGITEQRDDRPSDTRVVNRRYGTMVRARMGGSKRVCGQE